MKIGRALLIFRSFGGGCTIFAILPLIENGRWKSNGSPNPPKSLHTKNHHKLSKNLPPFLSPLLVPYFLLARKTRQNWATLKPTAPFQPQQAACRLVLRCSCSGHFIGVTFVTSKHTKRARVFKDGKKNLKNHHLIADFWGSRYRNYTFDFFGVKSKV